MRRPLRVALDVLAGVVVVGSAGLAVAFVALGDMPVIERAAQVLMILSLVLGWASLSSRGDA